MSQWVAPKIITPNIKVDPLETVSLENRRLQADFSWCQNQLSSPSLSRLSDDILFLIFSVCVDDDDKDILDTTAALWRISQTCRRWREVALSQPSLWKHVHVRLDEIHSTSRPVWLLRTWIKRSCSSPLKVSVHLGCDEELELERELEREVLELLVEESHRWREAYLYLGDRTDLYCWLAGKACSFPILRDLEIFISPPDWLFDDHAWSSLHLEGYGGFSDAPNLLKAKMSTYAGEQVPDIPLDHILTITLPWHQLKHLDWVYFGDAEFFEVAAKLCNLESFKIQLGYDDWGTAPSFTITRHLTLSTLRCFEFGPRTVEVLKSLLDNLTLPSLDDLRINFGSWVRMSDDESEMILGSVMSLYTRSSCPLRSLSLPIAAFSSPSSPWITSSLPSRTLTFRLSSLVSDRGKPRHISPGFDNLRNISLLCRLSTLHVVFSVQDTGMMQELCKNFLPVMVDVVTARRTNPHDTRSSPTFTTLHLDFKHSYRENVTFHLESSPMLQLFLELERGGLVLKGSAFGR